MKLAPPLPPARILSVACPKADPACIECEGWGVIPMSQGNRPCSRCRTTEHDLIWTEVPNPARARQLALDTGVAA
jgi:hypothetical protein